ncbi:MAG: hypothetical protein QM817_40125 [Archangium sp.]
MLLVALLASSVLTAAPVEVSGDGRGSNGPPPELHEELRKVPRLRFGVGTVGVVAMQSQDSFYSAGGGFGVSLESGVVLADVVSVFYRGELTSTLLSLYGSNGLFVDFALGEHLALGVGAAFTLWAPLVYDGRPVTNFVGFTFPVRAHFMFGERKSSVVAQRSGWTISLHVAPGLTVYPTNYEFDPRNGYAYSTHGFALTGGLGLGHLWW